MMAAFNVSLLNDFNYTETTHFIDPMEPRYRAKPIKSGEYVSTSSWGSGEFSEQGVKDKADFFSNLDAYSHAKNVEDALVDYWATKTDSSGSGSGSSTTSSSTKSSSTAASSTKDDKKSSSTTSSAAAATTTKDDKGGKGKGKRYVYEA